MDGMKLKMSAPMLRQMFNIMDINRDGTLDLSELINGFQVLFNKLLPLHVIRAVRVSEDVQLSSIFLSICGLCIFFGFIGIAFSSFVVSRSVSCFVETVDPRRVCLPSVASRTVSCKMRHFSRIYCVIIIFVVCNHPDCIIINV